MTKAIQHYLDGEPKGLTLEVILRTRYDVQHRILSLPPITDLPVLEFPFTYEACRLGGLIYSIAVLLPIPNSYLVLKELVQQLQTAIEMSRLESPGGIHADIHLWLGGIAALDKPERYWYVRELVALWNGPFSRIIYIGDPDMIFKITTANWPKSSLQYDGFQPLSGDALFVQTIHEIWRVQRKRVAPAFQPQVIDQQYSYVTKHLLNYIRLLDVAAETHTIRDISTLNILLTLLHWRSSVRHRSPSLISRPKMSHFATLRIDPSQIC
ncbi:uncharacterized protein RAG0_07577 [Rhynchosporium agropyri]|uniref:Uncharacterized protein n=1 Tax=Rhynchosporium agropyri TaxID=914238 RepID=A0A1E1KM56_9HELO|nr:uncharacterized protein RAG0_07577 [Rhynchosporium agropyri]